MTIELGMGLMFLILIGASIGWLVDQAKFKPCRYSDKRISVQAVKCPYCQSDLDGTSGRPEVSRAPPMFKALPDMVQAAIRGIAIAIPLGAGVGIICLAVFPLGGL